MQRHCILLCLLMLTILSVGVGARPQPRQRSVRRQLDAAYARMNYAMRQNEPVASRQLLKVLEDILAPGTLREQMLSGAKQTVAAGGDKDLKRTRSHNIRIKKLIVQGDRAIATVVQTADVMR